LNSNTSKFVIKYATISTIIISTILLAPLYLYFLILSNIHDAKIELELKSIGRNIIKQMDEFNPKYDDSFMFPRFKSYNAGLYDKNFKPIFTTIKSDIRNYSSGYFSDGDFKYYIIEFIGDKYFNSKYLIVSKIDTNYDVINKILLILLSIIILIFVLSILILKNFSKPFQKINQSLDNFIKDSIHEINTPLSIINANIDLYLLKNEENKYLSRIKSATKTLSTIYNDMDYLIKREIVKYKKEELNFSLFLKERVDYFSEIAKLRNIQLISHIQADVFINFNKSKLERVVDNNLSNAIKYSYENGDVIITLELEESFIIFKVQDFGVGMSNPEKIFDRYYREDLTKGGFGIGLNIVKNIIDDEKIELQLFSKPKNGTTFIYKFNISNNS